MSRRRPAEEGLLFDLPLERTPEATEPPPGEAIEQTVLPLAEEEDEERYFAEPAAPDLPGDGTSPTDAAPPIRSRQTAEPETATMRLRAAAGLTDLGVCAAVLVVLLVVLLAQGVRPGPADWPAGVLFLLTFSFLYSVLPLAFWGQTPGMALAGLRTTSSDGRPLTFRQAVLKWVGFVLTVALAGLPLLLALAGRSLSDLISRSTTRGLEPWRPRRPS